MERAKRRITMLGLLILTLCAAVLGDTEKSVKEGDDVEFQCQNAGTPNTRIEWKFNSGQNVALIYYNDRLTAPYIDRAENFQQGLLLKRVTRKDMGEYVCEITDDSSGKPVYTEQKTRLVVLVPPSVPMARIPTSATIGSSTTLYCVENDASPRPKFIWYKNNNKMPQDPKSSPTFQNTTYTIDPTTGDLTFSPMTASDTGEYYCEVSNGQGMQRSAAVVMEAYEKNVGGIVAAVIIVLLILGLIAFGFWFAYSRGHIGKKTNKKVIYSQPSETRSDKNFQQTSSFVV